MAASKRKFAVTTPSGKFRYFTQPHRAVDYMRAIGGTVIYKVDTKGFITGSVTTKGYARGASANPGRAGWMKVRAIRVTKNGTVQVKR